MDIFTTNADIQGVVITIPNITPDMVSKEDNKVTREGSTRNRLTLCRIPHEM
jgi:hypothetical protein